MSYRLDIYVRNEIKYMKWKMVCVFPQRSLIGEYCYSWNVIAINICLSLFVVGVESKLMTYVYIHLPMFLTGLQCYSYLGGTVL